MFQPHLDPDFTTIGLDTPDDRRWELEGDEARPLAALLVEAASELRRAQREIAAEEVSADE